MTRFTLGIAEIMRRLWNAAPDMDIETRKAIIDGPKLPRANKEEDNTRRTVRCLGLLSKRRFARRSPSTQLSTKLQLLFQQEHTLGT